MTIDQLTAQNDSYRQIIIMLKKCINECDVLIKKNEGLIGNQLEDMEQECTLCLGECNAHV